MATYTDRELQWMANHASKLQAAGYDMTQTNAILKSIKKNFDIQLEEDLNNYFTVSNVANKLGIVKYANQNIVLNPTITIQRTQGVFDRNSAPDRFEEMLQRTLNVCLSDFYEVFKQEVDKITNAVKTIQNPPYTLNLTDGNKTYSLDITSGVIDKGMGQTINLISTDGINAITGNTTATSIKPIFIKLTADDTSTTVLTATGGTAEPSSNFTVSCAPARAISEKTAPFMLNLSNGTSVDSLEVSEGTVNTSIIYSVELISTDGTTAITQATTATTTDPVFVRFTDGTTLKCVGGTVNPATNYAIFFSDMVYTVNAPFTIKLTSQSLNKDYYLDVTAGTYESNITYAVNLISTDGTNAITQLTQATSSNPVYVKLTGIEDNSVKVFTAFGGTVGVANDFTVSFESARPVTEKVAPFKLTLNTYELDITEGTVNTDLTYDVDTIFTGASTAISGITTATQANPVFVRFTDGTTLKATYGKVDVDTTYTIAFGNSVIDYAPFNFKINNVLFESVEGAIDTTKTYIINLVSTDGITPISSNTSASILTPVFVDLDDGTRLKVVNGTIDFNASGYNFGFDTV